MKKSLEKLSLLAVSLLVNSSGAILPSLPAITSEYASENPTFVELLSTLPSLFIMLTVPFSPNLAKKIGYKRTVQLGMLLCLVGGLMPIVTSSFTLLFISRIIFGVGIGLFNALLFSFSANNYKGKELSDMIGFQSAFEGIGGILVSFVVGQLVLHGWRTTLWVYLVIIPIFLVFSFFVKDIETFTAKNNQSKAKIKLDKSFVGYVALLIILITVYTTVSVKLTSLLLEGSYGNAQDSSNALALMGLGAMMAGLLFGKGVAVFKEWLLPISFVALSLAMFGLATTHNTMVMMFVVFLSGLAFRTFVPYLLDKANQVTDGSGERRTSLLLMAFNIGLAFAPVTIKSLQSLLGLAQVSQIFMAEAILVLVIALGAAFLASKQGKKTM